MKKKPTKKLTKSELRTQRLDARERIQQARKVATEAKKAKREALRDVRDTIKRARKALPAKLKLWREVNRQILRRAIEGERHATRADAVALKTGTIGRAHELIGRANKQIDEDLKHLRWLGAHRHQPVKSSARVAAGFRAAELKSEADEFTRSELPQELWPAWEEHKHRIKAGPRRTRWEAALEYFHDHPELVTEANQRALDRGIADTIAREHEERARMEPRKRARQYVSSAARELVPEHYGSKRSKKKAAKRKPPKKAKPSKASKLKPPKKTKPKKGKRGAVAGVPF